MRENRTSGSMRGCRKRATSRRACALLYDRRGDDPSHPTERHFCRSGRTAHGTVVSYSAWARGRMRELTSKRQSGKDEADHRGTDARASRLEELFPDGECRSGVQQDGCVRGLESASLAIPAGRAEAHDTAHVHLGSALWDGIASIDGHGEIPVASHTQKIIVKPCAGKRHARFESGN